MHIVYYDNGCRLVAQKGEYGSLDNKDEHPSGTYTIQLARAQAEELRDVLVKLLPKGG